MTSIETRTFDKVVSSFDGTVYFEDGSTLEISSAGSIVTYRHTEAVELGMEIV